MWLGDHLDMNIVVDWEVKHQTKQNLLPAECLIGNQLKNQKHKVYMF